MNYVKVVNNEVVEFYSPRSYANIERSKGENWFPLKQIKPQVNKGEFVAHSHYEILADKVVEHYTIEKVNIYYAKVNDVNELETENIRNGTRALVNNKEYVFRKNQWNEIKAVYKVVENE